MKALGLILSIFVVVMLALYLFDENHKALPFSELVMKEDSSLRVETDNGLITVYAGKDLNRSYEWENCRLEANLIPRQKRVFGSLGAHDGGGQVFYDLLNSQECNGISETLVEEGQLHFKDYKSVHEWLVRQPHFYRAQWTSDGLFMRWALNPESHQINVDVFQLCINGSRAETFWKAKDDRFTWSSPSARLNCVFVDDKAANQPKWKDE